MHPRIQDELAYARAAREHGKEGRARVCARRAAGWAIAIHYADQQSTLAERPRSALSQLRWLGAHKGTPLNLRKAANRLTEQINVDHDLPHEEDPLEDAELIVRELLHSEPTTKTQPES